MTAHLQSGDKTLCGMRAGTAYLADKLEKCSCYKCLHAVIKELTEAQKEIVLPEGFKFEGWIEDK